MAEVTANAIEERLIGFAVRIVKLADALPETLAGKHIARQLLRSGTSPDRLLPKLVLPKATPISSTN